MRLFFVVLFVVISGSLSAQELLKEFSSTASYTHSAEYPHKLAGLLSLPFFDDFSSGASYPSGLRWMSSSVSVNQHYAVDPPSKGVATFDALDAFGALYPGLGLAPRGADTLTSLSLAMGVSGLQNVFLSFYYQPQGLGDSPEPGDSLILQFYAPDAGEWKTVWNAAGEAQKPFEKVSIPIVRQEFLHDGFRFRFINRVSLTQGVDDIGLVGNVDHWNLDYVWLAANRSEGDALHDVAMVDGLGSLLRNYESMPWNHFQAAYTSEILPRLQIRYHNNDLVAHAVTRNFLIFNKYQPWATPEFFSGGTANIDPGAFSVLEQDVLNPFVASGVDSALFEIQAYLVTDVYDYKRNDTLLYRQKFSNYFAIDDGSSESGYGIVGINAQGSKIACRFRAYVPDSLRAVTLFFNPVLNNENQSVRFKVLIWADDRGAPGRLLQATEREFTPQPGFHTYVLDSAVSVQSYFFLGIEQQTSGFLNVGYDMNSYRPGILYFQTGGIWSPSAYSGALMIRPVVGQRLSLITDVPEPDKRLWNVTVYPNPVSGGMLRLRWSDDVLRDGMFVEIFSLTGRRVYASSLTGDVLNISDLSSGMYLVHITDSGTGRKIVRKIVVRK